MVVVKGRLEPEVGVLLVQALAAARESLYQRRRQRATFNAGAGDVSAEPAMWRSLLPMRRKLSTIAVEGPRGR